jgi:energy-coupling factor transporter ATP-binding protein EcfA2
MVTEHYNQLRRVVGGINNIIAMYSREVLTQTLEVYFELHSVTQKGEYKNDIKLIVKDMGEEKKIDSVSYGQMEQIALLVVISLNSIQRSPIMLFDEAMARFNPEARIKALSAIRETLSDITILIAEHHAEESDYDHALQL